MWKKMMAAGAVVLAMGVVAPIHGDSYLNATASACEEGGAIYQGTPGGIPYSEGVGYGSEKVYEKLYSDTDGKLLMNAFTYRVNLAPESAVAYPKLQAALDKLSADNRQDLVVNLTNWKADLQELYQQGKETGMYQEDTPFAYELSYGGYRADSNVFSCVGMEYVFLGGAHPYTDYRAVVIDSQTGKRLKLADVLKTTDGFAEIVANETEKELVNRQIEMDKANYTKAIQKLIDDKELQFALTEDGMKVFFGSYAIGPYAIGTFEIDIPQSKYFSIFNPQYIFYGFRPKG